VDTSQISQGDNPAKKTNKKFANNYNKYTIFLDK